MFGYHSYEFMYLLCKGQDDVTELNRLLLSMWTPVRETSAGANVLVVLSRLKGQS
jgi:hypothetical protein